MVSFTAALRYNLDLPHRLYVVADAAKLLGFFGIMGAAFANLFVSADHSIRSGSREFVLSLPFNFVAYWILFRFCAAITWYGHQRETTSASDPDEDSGRP